MDAKEYIVNYNLVATTGRFTESIKQLTGPVKELTTSLQGLKTSADSLSTVLQFKPTVSTQGFRTSLQVMEQMAKESASIINSLINSSIASPGVFAKQIQELKNIAAARDDLAKAKNNAVIKKGKVSESSQKEVSKSRSNIDSALSRLKADKPTIEASIVPVLDKAAVEAQMKSLAKSVEVPVIPVLDSAALREQIKAMGKLPVALTAVMDMSFLKGRLRESEIRVPIMPDLEGLRAMLGKFEGSVRVLLNPDFSILNERLATYSGQLRLKASIGNLSGLKNQVVDVLKTSAMPLSITADLSAVKAQIEALPKNLDLVAALDLSVVKAGLAKGMELPLKILPISTKNILSLTKGLQEKIVSTKVRESLGKIPVNLDFAKANEKLEKFALKMKEKLGKPIDIKLNVSGASAQLRSLWASVTAPGGEGGSNVVITGSATNKPGNGEGKAGGGKGKGAKVKAAPVSVGSGFGFPSLYQASNPAIDMMKGMGMMYGIMGMFQGISDAFSQAMDYQNVMKTSAAMLRENDKQGNFERRFANMEQTIRKVGMETKFTAPQVAGASRFMAMAGLNIDQINAAVRPVADVALIGDNDLSEIADKMTNIMTGFGLQKGDVKNNVRHAADVLTNTFTKSNTDIMQLAEAMQYAAPMAHLTGNKIEDVTAAIGVMGDAGIQASMAGTSTRMMLQNMMNPTKKQQAVWKQLGISTKNDDGSIRPLLEVLHDLRAKITGDSTGKATMTEQQTKMLGGLVSTLFRVTASAGAGTLIENLNKAEALAKSNKASAGLSGRIADEKKNTVQGLWAQMTSAFTDSNVKAFEAFQDVIKEMLKDVRDFMANADVAKDLKEIYGTLIDMLKFVGGVTKQFFGLYSAFSWLINPLIKAQFYVSVLTKMLAPFVAVGKAANTTYRFLTGLIKAKTAAEGAEAVAATSRLGKMKGALRGLGAGIMGILPKLALWGAGIAAVGLAIWGVVEAVKAQKKELARQKKLVDDHNNFFNKSIPILDGVDKVIINTRAVDMPAVKDTKPFKAYREMSLWNDFAKNHRGRESFAPGDELAISITKDYPYAKYLTADRSLRHGQQYYTILNEKQSLAQGAIMILQKSFIKSHQSMIDNLKKEYGRAVAIDEPTKRNAAIARYRAHREQVLRSVNPKGRDNLMHLRGYYSGEQIANMPVSSHHSTYEAWQALYAAIKGETEMVNMAAANAIQSYKESVDKHASIAEQTLKMEALLAQTYVKFEMPTGKFAHIMDVVKKNSIDWAKVSKAIADAGGNFSSYMDGYFRFVDDLTNKLYHMSDYTKQKAKDIWAQAYDEAATKMGSKATHDESARQIKQTQEQLIKDYQVLFPGASWHKARTEVMKHGTDWKTSVHFAAVDARDKMAKGDPSKGLKNLNEVTNAANAASDQRAFQSSYDRTAARPTQIIFNIDKLANFDKTSIMTADDKTMAESIESKVAQGVYLAFQQAVATLNMPVAQGA